MAEQFTIGERVLSMSTRTEGTVVAIDRDRYRIKVTVSQARRRVGAAAERELPSVLPPGNKTGPRSSES